MHPVHPRSLALGSRCSFVLKTMVPAGILVSAGILLGLVGMFRIQEDRVVLRDTSEALSFIQDLTELLGMILR
jgi:hypothetical protein